MPSGFDFSTAPQLVELSFTAWSALLNGFLAFLSPCIVPMLPVYAVYLMGEGPLHQRGKGARKQILLRMLGFAAGFIPFFMILGAGAGALGSLLKQYRDAFPYIGGALMVLFGLMMLGAVPGLRLFSVKADAKSMAAGGFVKMMLLGIVLAVLHVPVFIQRAADGRHRREHGRPRHMASAFVFTGHDRAVSFVHGAVRKAWRHAFLPAHQSGPDPQGGRGRNDTAWRAAAVQASVA